MFTNLVPNLDLSVSYSNDKKGSTKKKWVSFQHLMLESSFSFKLISLPNQFACKFFWIPDWDDIMEAGMTRKETLVSHASAVLY
ncbi:hypothetical protein wVul_0194 [Wolbachia endosymbiont of Armadillidium vulgare str. wVulC]|nr:hypothetical protein wVul_0194 [Wolbachia endosymbiont of Armadillidium vulgare str. wVulC]